MSDIADLTEIGKETNNLEFIFDIPLQLTVELGRTKLLVKEILQLNQGAVVELNRLAGEPMDVFVNSKLVARGEAVVVNEKLGVRIIDIVSSREWMEKMI